MKYSGFEKALSSVFSFFEWLCHNKWLIFDEK